MTAATKIHPDNHRSGGSERRRTCVRHRLGYDMVRYGTGSAYVVYRELLAVPHLKADLGTEIRVTETDDDQRHEPFARHTIYNTVRDNS